MNTKLIAIYRVTNRCYRLVFKINNITVTTEGLFTKDQIVEIFNISENDFKLFTTT